MDKRVMFITSAEDFVNVPVTNVSTRNNWCSALKYIPKFV